MYVNAQIEYVYELTVIEALSEFWVSLSCVKSGRQHDVYNRRAFHFLAELHVVASFF